MTPTPFAQRVYTLCKSIPRAKVTTYKAIAQALNCNSSQAIGQALKHNPYAPVVPCHRVINSNGTIGGFYGKTTGKQLQHKINLLTQEGITIRNGKIDLNQHSFHSFN